MKNTTLSRSTVSRTLLIMIIRTGLLAMPFYGGCTPVALTGYPPVETAQVVAATDQQLAIAKDTHVWTVEQQRLFSARVGLLSHREHVELARRLAVLINSGEVRVDTGRAPEEPPECTCIPGACAPVSAHQATPGLPPAKTVK